MDILEIKSLFSHFTGLECCLQISSLLFFIRYALALYFESLNVLFPMCTAGVHGIYFCFNNFSLLIKNNMSHLFLVDILSIEINLLMKIL